MEENEIKGNGILKSLFIKLGNYFSTRSSLSIILIYCFNTSIIIYLFYPIIPILLNYPPNNEVVSARMGTSNILQYIMINILSIILGTIFLKIIFRDIDKWNTIDIKNANNSGVLHDIRKKCIDMPYLVFLAQVFINIIPISILLLIVATINNISYLAPIKIIIMVFSMFSLAAVFSHTFSRGIFKKILLKTYNGEKLEGFRLGLRKKIFLHVIPMIVIAILFTAFIAYSRLIEEKGNSIYNTYKSIITQELSDNENIKNADDAFKILEKISIPNIKQVYFVKTPKGEIFTSKEYSLGGYIKYYISNPYKGDRIYDINAETQGVVKVINNRDGEWRVGIIFSVTNATTIYFIVFGFLAILLMNIFVLYYFSKSLSSDIFLVAENLNEIAEGEFVDLDKKIPVTSNDEIGDLVVAFNKILDKEKEHIKEVEEQQAILMEQERLASLGHLIGGIAHNLRTPIMSLSGGIEGLKDLIKEYDESIDDENVTKEDHHEIAKEMRVWIEKMRPYCTYMSDIITAVKGQTIQPDLKASLSFTIDELCKRIEILLEHELRNKRSKMIMDVKADRNIQIKGEISILIQVLNNLIINSVESYEGKGGNIDFIITNSDRTVEFIIKDYGSGIPEDIKRKLFKEMVTTKGSKGTGLGLYMSYSNIKARFGGKIRFESEKGKGTTFYIYIPYSV